MKRLELELVLKLVLLGHVPDRQHSAADCLIVSEVADSDVYQAPLPIVAGDPEQPAVDVLARGRVKYRVISDLLDVRYKAKGLSGRADRRLVRAVSLGGCPSGRGSRLRG